jgi:hypothetical protein
MARQRSSSTTTASAESTNDNKENQHASTNAKNIPSIEYLGNHVCSKPEIIKGDSNNNKKRKDDGTNVSGPLDKFVVPTSQGNASTRTKATTALRMQTLVSDHARHIKQGRLSVTYHFVRSIALEIPR